MIIVPELLYNLTVLIAFTAISDIVNRFVQKNRLNISIIQGLVFGIATIIAMMNPFVLSNGLIFDGRSVVLSLGALFYGPITGIVAAIFALFYRFMLGGSGLLVGELVIIFTTFVGVVFHLYFKRKGVLKINIGYLYMFGVIVHIVMLSVFLLLPDVLKTKTFETIALTVIIFYPIASVMIGLIIKRQLLNNKLFVDLEVKSKELFVTLNSIRDGVISTDLDLKILNLNKIALDLYKQSDLIGKQIQDVFKLVKGKHKLPIDISVELKQIVHNQSGSYLFVDDYYLKTQDGDFLSIICSISPIRDVDEKVIGAVVVFSDLSLLTKLKSSLNESQNLFETVFESSSNPISILDKNGHFVKINNAFCKLTGYNSSEILNDDFLYTKIIYQEDLADAQKNLDDLLTLSKENSVKERRLINRDGHVIWVILHSALVNSEENDGERFVVSQMVDITERKLKQKELEENNCKLEQLTNQLLEAKERAENADKLKTAFLSNMSHEIRTPLNGILGVAELLTDNVSNEEERKEFISIMNTSCKRLLETVEDVLDASKIVSKHLQLVETEFSIVSLIDHLSNSFELQFSEKSLSFKVIIDDEVKNDDRIFSDYKILFDIISKLLSNSLKFTLKGEVVLHCFSENENFLFEVKDSGVGISEDYLPSLFTAFSQEDISINRGFEGTGLGLAIVKGYILALKGDIRVESKKNVGSTFTVILPSRIKIIPQANSKDIASDDDFYLSFLVAEDDDISYLLMEKILLKEFRCIVYRAKTGIEAIDMLTNRPEINLIFMDVKMPEMDGYECVKEIRTFNQEIPIIAVTAYAFSYDFQHTMEVGCNDYISKPYNPRELLHKVKTFVG